MNQVPLLWTATGEAVPLDLDHLVTSRMLIQANSGGGKSHALRYLLEQTCGRIPHIVLDPEGEFASLREHFPYLLAGREGDVPATPDSAAMLCRRLLELEVSAIVDLYELKLAERRRFVRLFLDALMHLPRELWRPRLIAIDEIHVFAPERGDAESTEAVIALTTQGRKRGYSLVGATQRLSKLHKDVAAELLNVLIGRTGLDIDVRRVGDILGFDREQRQSLKFLEPGWFYAFGPAIAREVVTGRTGEVRTTHPQPGKVAPPAPPPPDELRALIAQLQDLPQEAAQQATDLASARQTIAALERRLAEQPARVKRVVERVEVPVVPPDVLAHLEQANATLASALAQLRAATTLPESEPTPAPDVAPTVPAAPPPIPAALDLDPGSRGLLAVMLRHHPLRVTRAQFATLARRGPKSSSYHDQLRGLKQAGLLDEHNQLYSLTPRALDLLGGDQPAPLNRAERIAAWQRALPEGPRRMFDVLAQAPARWLLRDDLARQSGFSPTSSSVDAHLRTLRLNDLVEVRRGQVRLNERQFT